MLFMEDIDEDIDEENFDSFAFHLLPGNEKVSLSTN